MSDFSELINCDDCGSSFVLTVVDSELEVTFCPLCSAELELVDEDDAEPEADYDEEPED
jgi:uncharacterized Zn finger protein (UPF0148 family)